MTTVEGDRELPLAGSLGCEPPAGPAAVIGASTGLFGAVWAQAEVRKVLKASGAHVLESELPVGLADGAFTEDGALADPDLSSRLADVVSDLAREVAAPVEQPA